jgi:hypothetical protein
MTEYVPTAESLVVLRSLPDNPTPPQVLALIEQVRMALHYVETPGEARTIVDQTQAVRYLAEKSRQSREVQNQAAEVALRAQREAGKVTTALEKNAGARTDIGPLDTVSRGYTKHEQLEEAGISDKEASRWERVARLDDETFEFYVAETQSLGRELTTAGALKLANAGLMGASDDEEWYTQPAYIEAARRVMGDIDLDPASCAEANKTVRARWYMTGLENGLEQEWRGRVFMNPPFGDAGPLFVTKLIEGYEHGQIEQAVLLCAARVDTLWFQPLFRYLVCFPQGRAQYYKPGQSSSPAFPSAVAYLGTEDGAFIREFGPFGSVMVRATYG